MDNKQTKSSWEKFFLLKVKHFTDLPITDYRITDFFLPILPITVYRKKFEFRFYRFTVTDFFSKFSATSLVPSACLAVCTNPIRLA
jgi:hypothetical protein